MRNASKLIFALLLPCIISACSDSSKSKKSNGDGSDFVGSSGIAVDGYLVGSTVTCDVDNDGKSDLNEPTATTDENGKFTFTVNCVSPLLIEGGLNKTSAIISNHVGDYSSSFSDCTLRLNDDKDFITIAELNGIFKQKTLDLLFEKVNLYTWQHQPNIGF